MCISQIAEEPKELSPCARNKDSELLALARTPHVHQVGVGEVDAKVSISLFLGVNLQ